MCGIVGILGSTPVAPLLVDALKRLEYRGYDSAGRRDARRRAISTRRRAEGKLRNLEAKLSRSPLVRPRRHRPHALGDPRRADRDQRPSACHRAARARPQRHHREFPGAEGRSSRPRGAGFDTETDTEVVAHLITRNLDRGMTPVDAVEATLARLEGAFALAILFDGEDDLMIGARRGSPLAVGHGDGEMFLGSDAIALAPFTDRITYLEDGDWAVLTRQGRHDLRRERRDRSSGRWCKTLAVEPARRQGQPSPLHGEGDLRAAGGRRPHARALSRLRRRPGGAAGRARRSTSPSSTGCRSPPAAPPSMPGSSRKYWFERFARLPVDIDIASEFRYREQPLARSGLSLVVSQSGETADTLASLRYAKSQGQTVGGDRQRAAIDHRARGRLRAADARRTRDRRRLDQGLHLPARGARRACASPPARRAGILTEADEEKLVRALSEVPRL